MQILIRKCDVCKSDVRNDTAEYQEFSRLTQPDGCELDVCKACTERLKNAQS